MTGFPGKVAKVTGKRQKAKGRRQEEQPYHKILRFFKLW
jgi:hypothetical protein